MDTPRRWNAASTPSLQGSEQNLIWVKCFNDLSNHLGAIFSRGKYDNSNLGLGHVKRIGMDTCIGASMIDDLLAACIDDLPAQSHSDPDLAICNTGERAQLCFLLRSSCVACDR